MDLTAHVDAYRGPLIGLIASCGAPWALVLVGLCIYATLSSPPANRPSAA